MRRWRRNHAVPLDGRELAQTRAASNLPLQRMFSSCRFSPPLPAAPACSGRRSAGIACRRAFRVGAALTLALLLHTLGLRPPRALPSRMASLISELASHEVPGLGAPVLPPALGLEALASALAIARDHGVSASGRRWRTCLRRHGNLLANQLPRRGHLYPYKGTRGARIVSARKGELRRSFRGAQVRGHWRAQVTRVSRGCTPERGVDVEDPGRGGGPRVSRLGGEAVAAGIPTSLRT